MRSVIHNYIHNNKNISGGSESVALRSAFLLSEQVLSTGCSYGTICYDEFMRGMSPEVKLRVIQENDTDDFKDLGGSPEFALNVLKAHKKIKHPTPAQIISYKKIEKTIDKLWEFGHLENLNKLQMLGMPQLAPLVNDNTFVILSVDYSDSELDDEYFYPTSKILTLDFEDDKEIDLFFLPMEFMFYADTQSLKRHSKPFYFRQLLSFPNINVLNVEELKAIKSNFSAETKIIHGRVDEWVKACATQSERETRNFFDREIQPLFPAIQKKIDTDTILQHVDSHYVDDKPRVEVMGGEVPLSLIWDFYSFTGILPEATLARLEEMNKLVKMGEKRVPVLANRGHGGIKNLKAKMKEMKKEEFVMPSRKIMDID